MDPADEIRRYLDLRSRRDVSGKLRFYREKAGDFLRMVRTQGVCKALSVVRKYLGSGSISGEQVGFDEDDGCIHVLDISYYINCPPTSGGNLRILAPLERMDPSSGIRFDFVFSTWSSDYAAVCEEYIRKIPVIRHVRGYPERDYMSRFGRRPSSLPIDVWATMDSGFADYVCGLVRSNHYDIIQIEHSQLAWLAPILRESSPSSKLVLDAHNVEYRIYESWLPYASGNGDDIRSRYELLKDWELRCFHWFDAAFTVSPVEEGILSRNGIRHVYTVPTGGGIDPGRYAPVDKNRPRLYDILYLGSMNWFPNVHGLKWFISDVLPLVLEDHPGVVLHIVGNGTPDPGLVEISKASPNIRFWGFQEDDVSFFQGARVFVVPLWIGAGARVKIPTAWASKVPVVSTTFGAEGAEAVSGSNILLADDPESFARSVSSLLDDPDYAEEISEEAFKTLCRSYTSDHCVSELVSDYTDIARSSDSEPDDVVAEPGPGRNADWS